MNLKTQLQEQTNHAKEKAEATIEQVKESASELKEKASDKAGELKEITQHRAEELSADGRSVVVETKDQLGATVKSVTGHIEEFVGRVLDNPAIEAEGLARQAEAKIQREHAGE